MSSEYYTLEKTAEVLGESPAEINRLRERSQLRAFRDGSSWKFRKEEIDNYLAEKIKSRGKQKASDSDFDLLGTDEEDEAPTILADSVSFDALMEDGLTLDDAMVDAKVSDAVVDDGLTLADGPEAEIDLALGDDEVVFDEAGSSPKLNLAQDSGLSLLDAEVELEAVEKGGSDAFLDADDDDLLALVEAESAENTSTIAVPVEVEDDFQLTPGTDIQSDDSESASQVIALEEDGFAAQMGMSPDPAFGAMPFGDAASPDAAQPGPFGAGEFGSQTTSSFAAGPTAAEPTYQPWVIGVMVANAALLALCGCVALDLIIHIWSWKEPFIINSTIMDLVAGGLR